MRIWCIPTSIRLEVAPSPLLPPRTDRDVIFRSPPPPPRLSRQEKLDRGVIVLKPKKAKNCKRPPPESVLKAKVVKPARSARRVRYADQEQYWVAPELVKQHREKQEEEGKGQQRSSISPAPCKEVSDRCEEAENEKTAEDEELKKKAEEKVEEEEEEDIFCDICCFQDRCTHEEVWRQREENRRQQEEEERLLALEAARRNSLDQQLLLGLDRAPSRGTEVVHSRQQSNTSGTSSLTSPSSTTNYHQSSGDPSAGSLNDLSYGHQDDPGYSSSSGRGSSGKKIRFNIYIFKSFS